MCNMTMLISLLKLDDKGKTILDVLDGKKEVMSQRL